MNDFNKLAVQMRSDWDRRIDHDYRFWMSDGHDSDEVMWESGRRDFGYVLGNLNPRECWRGEETLALEVGCGVGRLLRSAAEHFDHCIGIDISESAVEKAKEFLRDLPQVETLRGNGFDLNQIKDNSVHFLYSFAALTSIPTEVIASYLCEMHRVLRSDGTIRLQVYLGTPQQVLQDDTLHLRCFSEQHFRQAMKLAGFCITECEELVLPFQVSSKEMDIIAYMVSAERLDIASASVEEIASALLPDGELIESKQYSGRELECWMALGYARDLLSKGDVERARATINYVASFQTMVAIDIRDSLHEIEKALQQFEKQTEQTTEVPAANADTILAANIAILEKYFPEVAAAVKNASVSSRVEEYETSEGYALSYDHQALDHLTKPEAAAAKWVSSSLSQLKSTGPVLIYGFGSGYHVIQFLRQSERPLAVHEPSVEVFRKVCERHDYRDLFPRLHALSVGEKPPELVEQSVELIVRSQTQAAFPDCATLLRKSIQGLQGLRELHPRIAVLGPLHGGTLPIAAYTHMSLLGLGQRARDMNMSGFDESYKLIDGFLRDEGRRNLMKANLTESISQMVIEMLHEKPFDILLCMPFAPISVRALEELRKQGVITALWFVEDYQRFHHWQHQGHAFDFIFTIQEGEAISQIERSGAGHVSYLPSAAEPRVHHPMQLTSDEQRRYGSDLSFVGAGYHNRQQSFASLVGYDFKIWGTEWPGCKPFDSLVQEQGRRLTPAEYTKIFCASDINLNLHSSTERDGVDPTGDFVNPRTFELAACEAFQLVDERKLLSNLFVPGEEIVTFRSIAEMREQINFYLQHPEERTRYAAASRRRVLSEHTYEHRMQEMLKRIYGVRYDHLRSRESDSPWTRLLMRSDKFPELHSRCKVAFERGEEANLDGLVADIMTGQGSLTETEQKLLFLYHVRKQMIRIEASRAGGS